MKEFKIKTKCTCIQEYTVLADSLEEAQEKVFSCEHEESEALDYINEQLV